MALNMADFRRSRLVRPVSAALLIAGLFIGARDLLRAFNSLLWYSQLATTTEIGQLVQLRLIKLVEGYPVNFDRFNWLVGGLLAALGAAGLFLSRSNRVKP